MGGLYLTLSQDSVSINPNELNQYVNLNKEINLNRSIEYSLQAIKIFEEIGELYERSGFFINLADAYKLKGEYKKWGEALEEHHKLKDSVFNQENNDKIAALEKSREDDLKQKEIEKQKIRIAEQEKREQLILYFSIGLVFLMTVVMIVIYRLLKRSDKLLYNVLPVSIAKRLKKKEHPISDYFTQASIVFIDIVNFTELAKDEDPRRVVEALNKIFTKYDAIAKKYGLEKIKTIGDSYMAAAGIPEVQKDNTHRAAQMALEVKEMMKDYHTADGTKIEVRIGLDCGPVVAGVIGENKFIYDMWSDAVNTASRMESSSIAGQVHVSERFKEAVSEYEQFDYVERGEIEIKGKGKMKTFFMGSKLVEKV
jgi:class 3 adenylate cyclase